MGDSTCLDPDLLQLPELSPFAVKPSPQIADNLFSQWLSLPETGRLVIYFQSIIYFLCGFSLYIMVLCFG